MLPTTKDADLPQGSNVHETETNVAENGGPRKKRRLSNNVKNGTCKTSSDPLQSELNFHPHKKQKTVLTAEGVENAGTSMAEPQRKANFSAYGNHFHERSPLANNSAKPGQAKKLVIKNFKGKNFVLLLLQSVESMKIFIMCHFVKKCVSNEIVYLLQCAACANQLLRFVTEITTLLLFS